MRALIREGLKGWQRSDWWLVALFVGCLIAAWLFAGVHSRVASNQLLGVDYAARDWAMARRHPALIAFFEVLSWAGQGPVLISLAAIAAWFISRSKTLVVLVLLCGFASQEMVSGLKDAFARMRPPTGLAVKESLSFPSGHVSGTAAVMTLLSFAALRHRRHRVLVITAGAVLVIVTAFSRMFLDVHWLSDVMGGTFVGAALGFAFAILYELLSIRVRWRRRLPATVSRSGTAAGSSST